MFNIKQRRKELGLSLRKVAEAVGVDGSTVLRWENGETAIKLDKVVKLAEVLGVSSKVLLGDETISVRRKIDYGFVRVETVVPKLHLASAERNAEEMIKWITSTDANVIVFPETSLTGYSCGDLFYQKALNDRTKTEIANIVEISKTTDSVIIFGAPIEILGEKYNCAVVVAKGEVLGVVPKTFLPNYSEYYEKRWFASGADAPFNTVDAFDLGLETDKKIPFGNDLVFDIDNRYRFGIEICEDIWTPLPPSTYLALGGADLIFNLSASPEKITKQDYRKQLVSQQSARCNCGYAYVSAGPDESTSDVVYSGATVIYENGKKLAVNDKLMQSDYATAVDFDVEKIRYVRLHNRSFGDCARFYGSKTPCRRVNAVINQKMSDGKRRSVEKLPFVPSEKAQREKNASETFEIQVAGLARRLSATHCKAVVGISGGLDSTLALLVAVKAVQKAGMDVKDVIGITMPGFGTTDRTHDNAVNLMQKLGVTFTEISIKDAVLQHFQDIGQDRNTFDLTYENSQARERTQILMDYAGKVGGLVVGTGDLSELALGWCTYNGDHMSMYGVNAGVPKTFIRWIIDTVSKNDPAFGGCREILADILDTPISPELLPPDAQGKIAQKTESVVGPYALHDFFLSHFFGGETPEKIYYLAKIAFEKDFDAAEIKKWLINFYRRFFTQQFKRNAIPDGVKVGAVCLSPRGDWRMPSDAVAHDFIRRAENLED